MAILNFVRGSIIGKVGQFVGSSWKGKDYIKTYTPPANPNTTEQKAIRSVFQHVTAIARAINRTVLKPYTFPKPHAMTVLNRMMQINQKMFEGKVWDVTLLKIFEGPLYNPGITSAVLADATLTVTWNGSHGTPTDVAAVIVHSEESGLTSALLTTRSAGTTGAWDILELGATDPAQTHVYLVFAAPPTDETQGETSKTAYHPVTAS
jgi:hypothetical protein